MDSKKTFETLDHDLLLHKLRTYGFKHRSIEWVKSYLGNRKHVVRCEKCISNEQKIRYGVIDGLIGGPLYFIMYVIEILSVLSTEEDAKIIMCADDTVIRTPSHSFRTAIQNKQKIMQTV